MPRESQSERIQVAFDGKQLATLNGALAVLSGWRFEQKAARAIAAGVSAGDVERFADEVGELARRHFEACGLWPGESPWTKELIARRAGTSISIGLDGHQGAIAVAALRAAAAEFKDRWWEFCTVAPGGLDLYEVKESDLSRLADALAAAFDEPG